MPKNKEIEVRFHSSVYDSIRLPERLRNHLIKSLIEIDYEGIDWAGQEDGKEAHCWIYIRDVQQGGSDPEFYVISYHDLDDDNGPYRLYSAYSFENARSIRNDIREVFATGAIEYKARRESILSPSTALDNTLETGNYQGRYINDREYTPLVEKYHFVACEYIYWPDQDEEKEIVLSEIFGKVNKSSSRDCKGDITEPMVITYDFSAPKDRQHKVYNVPSMEEAIKLHTSLLPALKAGALQNLKDRIESLMNS